MSKWVPVLIRLEDYAEITALVADRESGRSDSPVEVFASPALPAERNADPDDVQLAARTLWSVDDLRSLASGTSETAKRWTLAMDACCEVAGSEDHWLLTSEVADRTGMGIKAWRDAPRKITRHLRANFPNVPLGADGEHIWPLFARTKPGSQEVSWAMSPEQADRWRQVRGYVS